MFQQRRAPTDEDVFWARLWKKGDSFIIDRARSTIRSQKKRKKEKSAR
jgi:hypothetical protein